MSRSGYSDDCDDDLAMGRWRAVINSATRGKRGQKFFRDLVAALDAMPEKRLIDGELQTIEGEVCALGALARHRGRSVRGMDTEDHRALGAEFDIARQLAAETMYMNDEDCQGETPEARWASVRRWAAKQIVPTEDELAAVTTGDRG
jgi:hypothetical protein